MPRNYDPKLHPFEVAREYQRALNAVKLERIFAKPFIGSLEGHGDVVQTLCKHPTKLSAVLSGACDGEIKLWSVSERKCIRTIQAHNGIVRNICTPSNGQHFFSTDSESIKQWSFDTNNNADDDDEHHPNEPMNTLISKSVIMGMDHHYRKPLLMTCGEKVQLWEETRTEPLRSFHWGVDTVYNVKFNAVETDICAGAGSDRSITLYDTRKSEPLRKVVLEMRTNAICWNPMEAFVFTAANEDYK